MKHITCRLKQVAESRGYSTQIALRDAMLAANGKANNKNTISRMWSNRSARYSLNVMLELCLFLECEVGDLLRLDG